MFVIDHAVIEKIYGRFINIQQADIFQEFGKEPEIDKMPDGMLGSADIQVNRQPGLGRFPAERFLAVFRIQIPQEIP